MHIASGLSGTYESAREAARVVADKGCRAGSRSSTARPAPAGSAAWSSAPPMPPSGASTLDEVVEAVQRTREGLDMWFCLDTLEYLRQGGRIGAAQALVGSALKIKPILTFGTEISPGRPRPHQEAGAWSGWSPTCTSCASAAPPAGSSSTPSRPSDAAALVAEGTAILGSEPLFCTQVGPVLGAHLGSGMLVGGIGCAPAAS